MNKLNHTYKTYIPLANSGLSIFGEVVDLLDAVDFDSVRHTGRGEG